MISLRMNFASVMRKIKTQLKSSLVKSYRNVTAHVCEVFARTCSLFPELFSLEIGHEGIVDRDVRNGDLMGHNDIWLTSPGRRWQNSHEANSEKAGGGGSSEKER